MLQSACVWRSPVTSMRKTLALPVACSRFCLSLFENQYSLPHFVHLYQLVLSRNPPDAANLNEKLHLCKQMGETNAAPTVNDPICFQVLFPSFGNFLCFLELRLSLEHQTLQRVAQGDQLSQCPLCGSHFSAGTVAAGQRCTLCLSADVVLR